MLFLSFICCTILLFFVNEKNFVVHGTFITKHNDNLLVQWNSNNNNKNPSLLKFSSPRPRQSIRHDKQQKRTINLQKHYMLLHMLQQQQTLNGDKSKYSRISRHNINKYKWTIRRPTMMTSSIIFKSTSISKVTSTTALSLVSVSSILSKVIVPLQSILLNNNIQLPLISKNDSWGNSCIIILSACVSQIIGSKTKIGQLLGTPVTAMVITFILASSNILQAGGTIPTQQLQLLSLQLSTPFILLGANFSKSILQQCGPLLISFLFASIATIIGCIFGWYCVGSILLQSAFPLSTNMSYDGLIIASALLAKNIGGGINYIAICTTFHASTNAIAAGLCIDNIFALIYFPLSSIIASYFPDITINTSTSATAITSTDPNSNIISITGSDYTTVDTVCTDDSINTSTTTNIMTPTPTVATTKATLVSTTTDSDANFTVQNILNVLGISVTLLWISQLLVGGNTGAALPVCTILSVLVSTFILPKTFMEPLRTVSNTFGLLTLYIFFATAGSSGIAIANSVRTSILPLSIYLFCLYSIHTTILCLLYTLFHKILFRNGIVVPASSPSTSTSRLLLLYKIKLLLYESVVPQRLLVASSAAIGGPATALALTKTVNWTSFEVPCIVIGNIGYTIATFCGYIFYNLFHTPL